MSLHVLFFSPFLAKETADIMTRFNYWLDPPFTHC